MLMHPITITIPHQLKPVGNQSQIPGCNSVSAQRGSAFGKVRGSNRRHEANMWTCFSLATGESVCSIGRFNTGRATKHRRASLFMENAFRAADIVHCLEEYFTYTLRKFLLSFSRQRRKLRVRTAERCTMRRLIVLKLHCRSGTTAAMPPHPVVHTSHVGQPPSFRHKLTIVHQVSHKHRMHLKPGVRRDSHSSYRQSTSHPLLIHLNVGSV